LVQRGFEEGFLQKRALQDVYLADRIDFRCVEDKRHSFSVPFKAITHVLIYKTSNHEIEIDTVEEVIFGNFKSNKSVNRAFELFESLLKGKVSYLEV
jgi:hypothetical protein